MFRSEPHSTQSAKSAGKTADGDPPWPRQERRERTKTSYPQQAVRMSAGFGAAPLQIARTSAALYMASIGYRKPDFEAQASAADGRFINSAPSSPTVDLV